MDERTKEYFDKIVAMDLGDLTKENEEFIRARRDYLSGSQKEKFAKILVVKKEAKKKK